MAVVQPESLPLLPASAGESAKEPLLKGEPGDLEAGRLAELQELLDEGMISQKEFEEKRGKIVDERKAETADPEDLEAGVEDERITELKEMLAEGLISQKEFEAKRQEIVGPAGLEPGPQLEAAGEAAGEPPANNGYTPLALVGTDEAEPDDDIEAGAGVGVSREPTALSREATSVEADADANEDKRKKKRKTIEERVAEKQKLEEEEKKEREKDRKGADAKLMAELWFNEIMDAVSDCTNFYDILKKKTLFKHFGIAGAGVCASSMFSCVLSIRGRTWLKRAMDEAVANDPRAQKQHPKGMSEDEVTVYLKAHEEEPAYAKLAMYDNLIEALVPIIEDVPSACLNATIIATHDGLVGTQITVFIMTVMNLFWKAGRIKESAMTAKHLYVERQKKMNSVQAHVEQAIHFKDPNLVHQLIQGFEEAKAKKGKKPDEEDEDNPLSLEFTVMDLDNCKVKPEFAASIGKAIRRCPELKKLNLGENDLLGTKIGLSNLVDGSGSGDLPLDHIILASCNIQANAGAMIGKFVDKCPDLEILDISGNEGLGTQAGLSGFVDSLDDRFGEHLNQLNLAGINLQDEAGAALGKLVKKCPKLPILSLSNNGKFGTKKSMEPFVTGLGKGPLAFTQIDLMNMNLQPDTGMAIGQLVAVCPLLQGLDISNNAALGTEEGLKGIVKGLGDKQIEVSTLNLDGLNIQPEAGFAVGQLLTKCPNLPRLDIGNNEAFGTVEGLESFIKGLGDGDLSFTELNLEGFNIRPESGASIGKLISRCPKLGSAVDLTKYDVFHTEEGLSTFVDGICTRDAVLFEALYLEGCSIDMEGAAEIGTFLSKVPEAGTALGKLFTKCPKLQTLDFTDLDSSCAVRAFQALVEGMGRDGKLRSIQEIKLGSCDIQEDCVLSLGMLFGKCTNMSILDLGSKTILGTGSGMRMLQEGIYKTAGETADLPFKKLKLQDCELREEAGEAVGKLIRNMKSLEMLDLKEYAGICTPDGLAGFATGIGRAQLSVTEIAFQPDVPNEAGGAVGTLIAQSPKIQVLDLTRQDFLCTAAGLNGIVNAIKGTPAGVIGIHTLKISASSIQNATGEEEEAVGDAVGQLIFKCPNIEILDFSDIPPRPEMIGLLGMETTNVKGPKNSALKGLCKAVGEGLPEVKEFHLEGCSMQGYNTHDAKDLATFIRKMPNIELLNLSGAMNIFGKLGRLNKEFDKLLAKENRTGCFSAPKDDNKIIIKELILTSCNIGKHNCAPLGALLMKLPQLLILDLSDNRLLGKNMSCLFKSGMFSSKGGLIESSTIRCLWTLKELRLCRCNLQPEVGGAVLGLAMACPELETLNLSGNLDLGKKNIKYGTNLQHFVHMMDDKFCKEAKKETAWDIVGTEELLKKKGWVPPVDEKGKEIKGAWRRPDGNPKTGGKDAWKPEEKEIIVVVKHVKHLYLENCSIVLGEHTGKKHPVEQLKEKFPGLEAVYGLPSSLSSFAGTAPAEDNLNLLKSSSRSNTRDRRTKSPGRTSSREGEDERITQLREMLDEGLLSPEEFEAKQKEILDSMAGPVARTTSNRNQPYLHMEGNYFTFKTGGDPAKVTDNFEFRTSGKKGTLFRDGSATTSMRDLGKRPIQGTFEINDNKLKGTSMINKLITGTVDPSGDIVWSGPSISLTSRKR
jgi:hypothetical protein